MTHKLLIAAIFGMSLNAVAQDEVGTSESPFVEPRATSDYKPSVGVKLGMANPEGSFNSGLGYGVEAAYQPYLPFGLGAELSGQVNEGKGLQAPLTRTMLLAKGMYNFGGTLPVIRNSYVGGALGPVWDNINSQSSVELGAGPQLGFDIPIGALEGAYTLGANATYLFISGEKADSLTASAVVKRWF